MFKFVRDLGVSCITWVCTMGSMVFGMELGKDLYKKCKEKHLEKNN